MCKTCWWTPWEAQHGIKSTSRIHQVSALLFSVEYICPKDFSVLSSCNSNPLPYYWILLFQEYLRVQSLVTGPPSQTMEMSFISSAISTSIQGVNKHHMHRDEQTEEVHKKVCSLWKSSSISHEYGSTNTCSKGRLYYSLLSCPIVAITGSGKAACDRKMQLHFWLRSLYKSPWVMNQKAHKKAKEKNVDSVFLL